MGELHLTNESILQDMIRPLKSESKDIVCGGGDGGRGEQHVCKVILVTSLSLSQAEQQTKQWDLSSVQFILCMCSDIHISGGKVFFKLSQTI